MNNSYLVIIGVIAVAYIIIMNIIRFFMKKKHGDNADSGDIIPSSENTTTTQHEVNDIVIGCNPDEAMKAYMEKTLQEDFNANDYQLVWASTFGNTDIERVVAYNDKQILVIPAKVQNGTLVMPEDQPSAAIDLSTVDHIHFGRKVSWVRIAFVTLFFDAKDDKNNFDIWGTKKDVCGNDNNPSFAKFIDFMEQWAKEHNVPAELIK